MIDVDVISNMTTKCGHTLVIFSVNVLAETGKLIMKLKLRDGPQKLDGLLR